MKPTIQIYVSIYDIQPTETLWDVIDDSHIPPDIYTKEQLYDSIKKDGLKHQIKLDPHGNIMNGNARYWTCRKLLVEGHFEFEYLPVEVEAILGTYIYEVDNVEVQEKITVLRKEIQEVQQQALHKLVYERENTKTPVIPQGKEFKDYTVSKKDDRKLQRTTDHEGDHIDMAVFPIKHKVKNKAIIIEDASHYMKSEKTKNDVFKYAHLED